MNVLAKNNSLFLFFSLESRLVFIESFHLLIFLTSIIKFLLPSTLQYTMQIKGVKTLDSCRSTGVSRGRGGGGGVTSPSCIPNKEKILEYPTIFSPRVI